jgi:hypothetical protein
MSSVGMDRTLSIVRNAPSGLGSILRLLDSMLSIGLALTLIMLYFLGNSCDTMVTVAEATGSIRSALFEFVDPLVVLR